MAYKQKYDPIAHPYHDNVVSNLRFMMKQTNTPIDTLTNEEIWTIFCQADEEAAVNAEVDIIAAELFVEKLNKE